jgi:hypothetical protein
MIKPPFSIADESVEDKKWRIILTNHQEHLTNIF